MEKFQTSNKLRGEFRTMMSQLNSLQYNACPSEDVWRNEHPDTVLESASVMLHILPQLESVLKDICYHAQEFIDERDNPTEPEEPETARIGGPDMFMDEDGNLL